MAEFIRIYFMRRGHVLDRLGNISDHYDRHFCALSSGGLQKARWNLKRLHPMLYEVQYLSSRHFRCELGLVHSGADLQNGAVFSSATG